MSTMKKMHYSTNHCQVIINAILFSPFVRLPLETLRILLFLINQYLTITYDVCPNIYLILQIFFY